MLFICVLNMARPMNIVLMGLMQGCKHRIIYGRFGSRRQGPKHECFIYIYVLGRKVKDSNFCGEAPSVFKTDPINQALATFHGFDDAGFLRC
jgi:hypothetical protein